MVVFLVKVFSVESFERFCTVPVCGKGSKKKRPPNQVGRFSTVNEGVPFPLGNTRLLPPVPVRVANPGGIDIYFCKALAAPLM
jgi:hypothetical protein